MAMMKSVIRPPAESEHNTSSVCIAASMATMYTPMLDDDDCGRGGMVNLPMANALKLVRLAACSAGLAFLNRPTSADSWEIGVS